MKKKGPSNVFDLPKWMSNLRAREPQGTRTPDQVASSLELSLLLHGDVEMLKNLIVKLTPQVPLKHQKFMRGLLDGDVLSNVKEFINKTNVSLVRLSKAEARHYG